MAKGYIYCISNPSFRENLFKIGFTTQNLQKRILSLYKTGVPTKFTINFAKMVKNCRLTEHEIHLKLKKLRVNPSREFFNCTLLKIRGIFEKVEGTWWGQDETKKEEVVEQKMKQKTKRVNSSANAEKTIKIKKVVKSHKRIKLYRKVKLFKVNYKV